MPQIRRGELRRRRVAGRSWRRYATAMSTPRMKRRRLGVLKKLFNIAPWLAPEFREQA
jgi:hypothetical protein